MPETPQEKGWALTVWQGLTVWTLHMCVREVEEEMIHKAYGRWLAEFIGTVSPWRMWGFGRWTEMWEKPSFRTEYRVNSGTRRHSKLGEREREGLRKEGKKRWRDRKLKRQTNRKMDRASLDTDRQHPRETRAEANLMERSCTQCYGRKSRRVQHGPLVI